MAVIGGGNSAGEEGLFLTKFASQVTIVTRDPSLTASKVVVSKIAEHDDIEVLTGTVPVAFKGNSHLSTVTVQDVDSRREREI